MKKSAFPIVITQKSSAGAVAVLGLSLKSILKSDLFFEQYNNNEGDDNLASSSKHKQRVLLREGLLQAISTWPKTITLELLITSLPNLQCNAQGRVLITMVLRAKAKTELKAKQDAIEKYMSLQTLILSHMTDVEFVAITEKKSYSFI